MPRPVSYASMPSPVGRIWLGATKHGLIRVSFFTDELGFCSEIEATMRVMPQWDPTALAPYIAQLTDYFSGSRTSFDLPLDLGRATPFQRGVLEAVADVPYGEVQSYGEIARAVGNPYAARAVGGVMATNPISIVIPCHRIVRSDGTHGKYALRSLGPTGASYKRLLLELEGCVYPLREAAR